MSQKTVFIIGAGASKEVNLPIGSELKKSIANVLTFTTNNSYGGPGSGDEIIADAFRIKSAEYQSFFKASAEICRAMPQAISIDNFLDARSGNESIVFCGKLAIVRTILQAEAKSSLSINPGSNKINFHEVEDTWFNSFFQQLTENCKPKDLEKRMNSIALIIFNYDRCIEHYLYHALKNYYSISTQEAIQLLQQIEIYHPYGSVGSLPWQDTSCFIEYGANPSADQLIEKAQKIKTFTEGNDESSSQIKSIRSHMETSHRFIFLGFAFHPLNMELLLPSPLTSNSSAKRHIYATCHGISVENEIYIKQELKNKLRIDASNTSLLNICMSNCSCNELLKDNKYSLSFI